jgi:hypothetical protein
MTPGILPRRYARRPRRTQRSRDCQGALAGFLAQPRPPRARKTPAKNFNSQDRFLCLSVQWKNGLLDQAARAIVLQAFLFHLAIQDASTEFFCAGQMHRTRDACAVGCHSSVRRVAIHRAASGCRKFWRAASTEPFALQVIVAGCRRAPKTFPKRA